MEKKKQEMTEYHISVMTIQSR